MLFFGFFTASLEVLIFGAPTCTDLPCSPLPLSTEIFLLLLFCSPILGLVGALAVGRHWRTGSLTLLIGGVLPLISGAGLALTSNFDYGSPIYFFLSLLIFSFIFVWWAPLLILAGVLALSDSPRKRANRIAGREFRRT